MTPDYATLAAEVADARAHSLTLLTDLDDERLTVPYLPILNPFLWELGHVAWFQEYWVLGHTLGRSPLAMF